MKAYTLIIKGNGLHDTLKHIADIGVENAIRDDTIQVMDYQDVFLKNKQLDTKCRESAIREKEAVKKNRRMKRILKRLWKRRTR